MRLTSTGTGEQRPAIAEHATVDQDVADANLATRGDTAAFERIYYRHNARIYALARRIVGTDLAEDATQDVFVRAWERIGQFRHEASLGSWLYRVAVTVLLRQAATARRIAQRISSTDLSQIAGSSSSSAPHIDVERALQRLTEEVRTVVVLHDMEDHPHEKIAELLGISISASKMRLHRGRMQLREWLPR